MPPPFPLEYRRAMVHVPAAIGEGNEQPVHLASAHVDMINKINALERYFTSVNVTQASKVKIGRGSRHVHFGATPVRRNHPSPVANSDAGGRGLVVDLMDIYSDPSEERINISME
jgi:hypothetical protein